MIPFSATTSIGLSSKWAMSSLIWLFEKASVTDDVVCAVAKWTCASEYERLRRPFRLILGWCEKFEECMASVVKSGMLVGTVIDSLNHEILMEQMFLSAKARGAERR